MRSIALSALVLAMACQGPQPLPRVEVPPAAPVAEQARPMPAATGDEAVTQQWLEQEVARLRREHGQQVPGAQPAPGGAAAPPPAQPLSPTNEEATNAWLERMIEEKRAANPAPPPQEPQQQQQQQGGQPVERTVYVDRPYYVHGYDQYGQPAYQYGQGYGNGYGPYPNNYQTPFPVGTALGAGVGAIIGNQSHHQSAQGAAIGAGIGFLFDLARWHH